MLSCRICGAELVRKATDSKRVRWHWTVQAWRSKRSFWGVELRRRPRLKHSQVRVHLGRRHMTLMCVSQVVRSRV